MKKILPFKIRPFNMANFSGGSGYMMFYYAFILLVTYPLYFIVSIPLSRLGARKNEASPTVDTRKVKSMLKHIYLPVTAVISVILTVVYDYIGFVYSGGILAWVAEFYCACTPFAMIFTAIMIVVKKKSDEEGYIKRSVLINSSFIYLFVFTIAAFCFSLLFALIL